ncbi:MAG: TetR/AcrR family transcriptional regulator [Prevotella sp.]|jgi:AcrR family transcriptional regulator|nr:TetR/AcrR family transcriptional regulator [Prevotella sp.]
MKDTRNEIITIANDLIRSVGYNAFSYADISKELNIKNAAIHYYFPAKGDLGVEVIKRNLFAFKEKTDFWKNLDCSQQLMNYITMHDRFIDKHFACIVGSLSPSYDTLPENMQKELQKLVNTIIGWLSDILDKGKKAGVFKFDETSLEQAYVIHSAMLSALLMNKVLKNDIYKSIQYSLLNI